MAKMFIGKDCYEISKEQGSDLIELLKDYKVSDKIIIKELSENELVRIIIDGMTFELLKRIFINYKDMIEDILKKKIQK